MSGLFGQDRAFAASDVAPADGEVRVDCIWPGPARLGESPLWDPRRNRLFWIDSLGQKIWSAEADGGDARAWAVPDVIGSIGLCADDRLIAGFGRGFGFVTLADDEAEVEWIGDPEPDRNDTRMNDGKVDRQGRFWCGSMNRDFAATNASLYRLDPDLDWTRVDGGFMVSNGIAFSPDGRRMYFSDSRMDRSHQYDLDPVTGVVSARRAFVDTSAFAGRIDGATVDTAGRYWAALFEGGAVACFSAEGTLLRRIELPVSCPTMCSFGGPEMDILFVTSANFTMSPEERDKEPRAGGLFAVTGLRTRGLPEPRFGEKGE